ncbi:Starch synthase 1, chloroplastic/amyloplastic [Vitis vinifera]|uniref:starch synthase n=1 Tax=Vitis vinifera TaxID=29760 RepID=A0A438HX30_VITVI|nr:Starch synthase 1, chloroplastic/amyloplastic [Vitis vinifera]
MESLQSPLVLSSKLLPNSLKKPVLEVGKGGGGGSQDGSSAMLVNTEKKDASDSVGFHLVPPPSGDNGVIDPHEKLSTQKEAETGNSEGEEERKTKVTYNIVFVTSESAPYSKTGGLGDVCGSLPIALAARGHRVMVVSPRYQNGTCSDENFSGASDLEHPIKVHCFGGVQEVSFFHEYRAGVDWVFVDHPSYHRPGNPYGDGYGAFGDNQFRFTLLCHAACEAPLVLPLGGFTYGEKCLFLVNDWHAGLVPVLLAAKYRPHGVYEDARTVLVIHNLAHQGVEPAVTYDNLGLPPEWYGAVEWVFPTWARTHALDTGQAVNLLKGAIVTVDRILTVSKGYAWEVTTPEGGYGLHELLTSRKAVINGITNGIDVSEWDPSSDEHIPFHYSAEDLSGKVQCKIALQKELGLPIRPDCPLIGFIGRLDYQKGIDVIRLATPELMGEDVQLVTLANRLNQLGYRSTGYSLVEVQSRDAKNTLSLPVAFLSRSRDLSSQSKVTVTCQALNAPTVSEPINPQLNWSRPLFDFLAPKVMLGSGNPEDEEWMRVMESTYRDKFRGWVGFNVPISHRITASCDILLMPSRFEPCGLNQLYAMRYGAVPVVHGTGGLRDTVENFNPYAGGGSGEGTGWTFSPLSKDTMLAALRVATRTYREHKPSWERLMKRGMEKDYTWDKAALEYEQVFKWAFIDPPYVS